MICLCTTQTKHTIQIHHSHSVSSVPFSLHHHLSVIQSYNCFMLKHPWQYPTHCIFAPLNLLTNNYTHYPRELTINSTHIARNLQLIIIKLSIIINCKGFLTVPYSKWVSLHYLLAGNAVTISMISNSCLTLMAMVLCWHWGLWHSISSSPASQPSVSQSETNNKETISLSSGECLVHNQIYTTPNKALWINMQDTHVLLTWSRKNTTIWLKLITSNIMHTCWNWSAMSYMTN